MAQKEKQVILSKYNTFKLFSLLKYEYRMGTGVETYMYYGRILMGARFVPDEDKIAKAVLSTADALRPDNKLYTVWFDVYELNTQLLSKSEKYWIEIQVGDYIFPQPDLVKDEDSKFFSKYSNALERFIWKDRRYKSCKEVKLYKF